MGLDTTHECWHGAYGGFKRWRDEIATAAGYTFAEFESPYGPRSFVAEINWDALEAKNYQGDWDRLPEDPLILLLAHSDCDGHIWPKHAALIADRLEQVLSKLPEDDAADRVVGWGHRQKTEQFIKGLRAAVEAGERVEFH